MGAVQQQRIIDRYASLQQQVRGGVIEALAQLWQGLTSWRDADAQAFAAQAAQLVAGGQRAVASLTDVYLATLLADMVGGDVAPVGVDPGLVAGGLRGVDPQQVYQRPFEQVWTELGKGKPLTEAVAAGERRARLLGETDLQLAKTHTAREVMSSREDIVAYRRVLNGAGNCGLCVISSTQRYHKRDLLPIHPGCDCGVAPVIGREDPGQVIDQALLDEAHAAIEERFGTFDAGGRAPDYRKVLLVREHGELGPVLTVRSHKFTGADGLNVDQAASELPRRRRNRTGDAGGPPQNPPPPTSAPTPAEPPRRRLVDEVIAKPVDEGGLTEAEIREGIAEVIDGEYAGFTVQVDSVSSYPDQTIAYGKIYHPDAGEVGRVTRMLNRDDDGTLWAYHAFLRLREDMRGQGFSKAFNRHLVDWYRESGVDRIELNANIDIGGYTWAASGYHFADEESAGHILNLLRTRADEYERLANQLRQLVNTGARPDLARQVISLDDQVAAARDILDAAESTTFGALDFPTAYEVSQCGRWAGAGTEDVWLGKAAMLGSSWDGVKPL